MSQIKYQCEACIHRNVCQMQGCFIDTSEDVDRLLLEKAYGNCFQISMECIHYRVDENACTGGGSGGGGATTCHATTEDRNSDTSGQVSASSNSTPTAPINTLPQKIKLIIRKGYVVHPLYNPPISEMIGRPATLVYPDGVFKEVAVKKVERVAKARSGVTVMYVITVAEVNDSETAYQFYDHQLEFVQEE